MNKLLSKIKSYLFDSEVKEGELKDNGEIKVDIILYKCLKCGNFFKELKNVDGIKIDGFTYRKVSPCCEYYYLYRKKEGAK